MAAQRDASVTSAGPGSSEDNRGAQEAVTRLGALLEESRVVAGSYAGDISD